MQALRDSNTAGQRFSWLVRPAIAGISLLALVVVAEVLGDRWWLFDLANHFQAQVLGGLLVVLGLFAVVRHRRGALVAAVLVAIQFLLCIPAVFSFGRGATDRDVPHGGSLRVMTLNVWARNRQYERVVELIRQESPDIFVLEEIDAEWDQPLKSLEEDWPHRIMLLEGGHFGIALLSRIPLAEARIERIDGAIPAIFARIMIEERPVSLCGAHLTRPTSRAGAARQARQYDELVELLSKEPGAQIVIGDFNATPWTGTFTQFCERSRLRSAREGFGVMPSWPAFLPGILRIPIDHCLVSPEVTVRSIRLSPGVGSDHLPVFVDLVVATGSSF